MNLISLFYMKISSFLALFVGDADFSPVHVFCLFVLYQTAVVKKYSHPDLTFLLFVFMLLPSCFLLI